jgi:hypothetical protein
VRTKTRATWSARRPEYEHGRVAPGQSALPRPDYTKADLAEYYDAVAEVMLPHLGARALMLHRFPDGIDETGFYQKQLPANAPEFLATATVDSNNRSGQVRGGAPPRTRRSERWELAPAAPSIATTSARLAGAVARPALARPDPIGWTTSG